MGVKVDTFCWFIDLRLGCIITGILGIGFTIISIALSLESHESAITGLTLSVLGNGCLIFAAVYTSGSTQIRKTAVLVYIFLVLSNVLIVFIATIIKCVALGSTSGTDERYESTIPRIYAQALVVCLTWVLLDMYFVLVALSFYQELNEGNITTTEGLPHGISISTSKN